MNIGNTKKCPKCQAAILASRRFCGICGFDTENNTSQNSNQVKVICLSCGFLVSKGVKFCPECGRKLNLCPNCNRDIPENAKSCPKCGISLPEICAKCGASISPGVKFCPECGEPLVKQCHACNAKINGSPKFCPECGIKLQ